MNKEKVSVIVPVYNMEKYLNDSLDSLINQTYRNLEILIIDDGSTDNSLKICNEYALKDERIKIIHQENQGLSGARNTGLDNASGDYYAFLDSDDVLIDTMIEELYNLLIKYDADISMCSVIKKIQSEEFCFRQVEKENITVYEGREKSELINLYNLNSAIQCNKLFKKEILKDIRFPLGKYHEDEFVIHRELYNANRIVETNRMLYIYLRHKDSITSNKTAKNEYDICLAYLDRIRFAEEKKLEYMKTAALAYLNRHVDTNIKNYTYFDGHMEYLEKMCSIKHSISNGYLPADESEIKLSNVYKHAYLLMIHKNDLFLDMLLEQLDFPLNDIYIHIDKKCKSFTFNDIKKLKYARTYNVDPIEVNWGGYSQIKCEYVLMKAARENGPYFYYHFMQGESYPLKSQHYIYQYFEQKKDKILVCIDNYQDVSQRVKTIYLFNESYGKFSKIDMKLANFTTKFSDFQNKIGFDRFRKFNLEIRKGFCLWSIPNDFLEYLLEKEKLVHKIFKYSYCCDEIYIQTLAYNSKFRDRINFDKEQKYSTSKWYSTWSLKEGRPGHYFRFEDIPNIINSDCLFARKFTGQEGLAIIMTLKKHIEVSNE